MAEDLNELYLCVRLPAILAHRITTHFNAMSIVNQAVEDAVGSGGIADLFVPLRYRDLK